MDKKLFVFINKMAGKSELLDKLMIYASNEMRYIYPIAFIFILIYQPKRTRRNFLFTSAFIMLLNYCVIFLVKKIKYRPRPFITRQANVLLSSKLDSSYLSKHTLFAFSISTLIYMINKVLGKYLFILSMFMGLSRVWVGVHYPLDAVRGGILGSLCSLVMKLIFIK
ncbi:undecaprenyl-diphosphatase [Metabacillus crassostreae]|uniref:phosphatase PAP2 family protein n=1 Tax=Metabacillus crassostreae TaxID=929098 RepID=UPI00195B5F26|nr:phosphatase PAP2 family protein [Metabacillus crassostreae]MBM7603178.1 undecaprenyl-diphosphatase [Metabacillus crassostreae]